MRRRRSRLIPIRPTAHRNFVDPYHSRQLVILEVLWSETISVWHSCLDSSNALVASKHRHHFIPSLAMSSSLPVMRDSVNHHRFEEVEGGMVRVYLFQRCFRFGSRWHDLTLLKWNVEGLFFYRLGVMRVLLVLEKPLGPYSSKESITKRRGRGERGGAPDCFESWPTGTYPCRPCVSPKP